MGKKKPKRKKILTELQEQLKKLGERLTLDDLITISVGIWAAAHTREPTHALTGMVGYKLARSDNIVSGAAGVATLGGLGLAGLTSADRDKFFFWGIHYPDWWPFKIEGLPKIK